MLVESNTLPISSFYTDDRALPLPENERRLADVDWIAAECSYGPSIIDQEKYVKYLQGLGLTIEQAAIFSQKAAINFSSTTHNPLFWQDIMAAAEPTNLEILDIYRKIISKYHQAGNLIDRIIFCRDGTAPTTVFQQAVQADYFFMPDELGSGTAAAAQSAGKRPEIIHLSHRDAAGRPQNYLSQMVEIYEHLKAKNPEVKFACQIGVPSKTGLMPEGLENFLKEAAEWGRLNILIDAVQLRDISDLSLTQTINRLLGEGKIYLAGSFSKFAGGAAFSGYIVLPDEVLPAGNQDVVNNKAFLKRMAESLPRLSTGLVLTVEQRKAIEADLADFVRGQWQETMGDWAPLDQANQMTNTVFCFQPPINFPEDYDLVKEQGKRYIDFMAKPYSGSDNPLDRLTFIPAMPVGKLWRFALNLNQIILASTPEGMEQMKTIIKVFIDKHVHYSRETR